VARFGRGRVSLPGGCAIGARPINLHLKGLEVLGATVKLEHGYVEARADRLTGTTFCFDTISVTGTENLMMAAALAEGMTILENAAREPEIPDLADLLNKMGASIEGAGTDTIRIHGVARLHGAEHRIIPDRIEAGTFLVAAAITGGHLLIEGADPTHLAATISKLKESGVVIQPGSPDTLEVKSPNKLHSVDVTTQEYPGFPTDMQAQFMALMTQADGTSVITETIFENRFLHAFELMRMGADITMEGRRAVVRGRTSLAGAMIQASDLRASASLVLAAIAAEGETLIDRVYHIDRGYERIEEKLVGVGAKIRRISE
jgi:UDP-N-acetylglucosamine 1-carboxyvinyltransferase